MRSNALNPGSDISRLTGDEIEGAYRILCAAMLTRAAQEICTRTAPNEEGYARKRAARNWLYCGTGVITFQEACDAMNLAASLYIERLHSSAANLARAPKNRVNAPNAFAIGSRLNANASDPPQASPDYP